MATDEERDERRVRDLFDATHEEASQQALDRLARSAAQIPGSRPSWFRRWRIALGVGLAGALAAVALLAAQATPDAGAPEVATPTVTAPTVDAVAPNEDEAFVAEVLAIPDHEDDELALFDEELTDGLDSTGRQDSDPLVALDLLGGPPEGADLESWHALYDSLLDEDS